MDRAEAAREIIEDTNVSSPDRNIIAARTSILGDCCTFATKTRSHEDVLWIGPTTAIVLYAWNGSGSFMNQPFAPTTIASTVWTKRGDKWVAVYHEESDAPKQ